MLSIAKISAVVYFAMSVLFVLPLILMMSAIVAGVPAQNNQPNPFMHGAPFFIGFALTAPFAYAAMGFIMGALLAWIYNLVAGWIGGIEMYFETIPAGTLPNAPAQPYVP